MKYLMKFSMFLIVALSLTFVACEKDDLSSDVLDAQIDNFTLDGQNGGVMDHRGPRQQCFDLVYPVTLEFPDGSSVEVGDKDEMIEALKEYRASNPGTMERPKIQFPYDIELKNGDVVTLESIDDLKDALQKCKVLKRRHKKGKKGKKGAGDCFEINFPVTIEFPDGSTLEVADRDAMREAMMDWHQNNPGSIDRPEFVFPIDVTLKNGDVVTVEDEDGLKELAMECGDRGGRGPGDCFEINFPVTIEFPDGSTVEVADRDEMREAMMDWKQNNPGSTDRPQFVFPIEVTLKNGDVKSIEDAEAFKELIQTCGKKGRRGGHGNGGGNGGGHGGNGGGNGGGHGGNGGGHGGGHGGG